ncbi:hypothetical protein G8770_22140 [Aestuariicella hydrocarbonica]|uniref:F5/8 type C domain-containing protein n=1 Tax=Pseudomaricurvus hydrocarbonicus TaxID=1470433 RepID=A0A9E5MQ16_9GAMM|nr:polysaccharide lyase family 7 protein [Aestuariicella hydrocarbonica]NHO68260.1 hypothetical protein [Aestuariicella hydrocarbonica]
MYSRLAQIVVTLAGSAFAIPAISGTGNDDFQLIHPISAMASSSDGNQAENAIDEDLSPGSRWSAKGKGQWLQLELDSKQSICGIALAFYRGDERQALFDVATSPDGVNWTTQREQIQSSGLSLDLEYFTFQKSDTYYLKFIGYGNSKSNWNSVTEAYAFTSAPGLIGVCPNEESPIVTDPGSNTETSLPLKPASVTASSDDGHGPENVIDNSFDPESRWSAEGTDEWLKMELGSTQIVTGIGLAFYKGDERVALFDVETSIDGNNWTKQLYNQQSSGQSLDFEYFNFPQTEAAYLRFVGYGNSNSAWNSVVETTVLVSSDAATNGDLTDTGTTPDTGTDAGAEVTTPDSNLSPSQNFNLDTWKLTLPVSKDFYFGDGGSSSAEILPFEENGLYAPLNEGYQDTEFFFTNSEDGSMSFRAPLSGGTSTTNSSYVRTELRELYNWNPGESTGAANWNNEGFHQLSGTLQVTEYWPEDPQTVVGQIHAKDSSKALLKLQWDGPGKPVRAIINRSPDSGDPFSLTFDTVGLEKFSYVITLENNTLTIQVNDNIQSVVFGQNSMSSSWNDHVYYFKAGNYAQADKSGGGVFEVNFYNLEIQHMP